jgi:hypothetical protein
MSTCFDIYTLPSGCSVIQTYPSAPHPAPPDGGGGGGVRPSLKPWIHKPYSPEKKTHRKKKRYDTVDEMLFALGLLDP